jgi:hypothetical protein
LQVEFVGIVHSDRQIQRPAGEARTAERHVLEVDVGLLEHPWQTGTTSEQKGAEDAAGDPSPAPDVPDR